MNTLNDLMVQTSQLTLLFVEDDQVARESIHELLKDFFKEVVVAVDGEDGLEKFRQHPIDMVLTDINMPGMDGLQMATKIREINPDITVIMLSAYTELDYFKQSIQLGVHGYISKPIEMDNMIDVLSGAATKALLHAERRRHVLECESHTNYLQSIIASIQDPIMIVHDDYRIELLNDSPYHPKTEDGGEESPQTCHYLLHGLETPCDPTVRVCPLHEMRQEKKTILVPHEYTKFGATYKFEIQATPLPDKNGRFAGFVGTAREISRHLTVQEKLKKEKEALNYRAHHDSLTQLPNRTLFDLRLAEAIQRVDERKHKVALLFIDLDEFKTINDLLGHQTGDQVLQQASGIMRKALRKGDTLARIGGDEFALIAPDVSQKEESVGIAQKLLSVLRDSLSIGEQNIPLSASIGIAHYPDDSRDTAKLLSLADDAMYRAKSTPEHIALYRS